MIRPRLCLVETLDDAMELKRWLGERREVLGIDTETGGLNWWRADLRTVQVGDMETGWVIPFQDWRALCREIIEPYDREIVFHNFKFDCLFLEKNGIKVPRARLHDTMFLVSVGDPGQSVGLKAAGTRLIDSAYGAGQAALTHAMAEGKWGWHDVPIDLPAYWGYAALDPVITAHLYHWGKAWHKSDLYEMEIAATDVLLRAERRGMRIDTDYCSTAQVALMQQADELRAWALTEWGVDNLTSDMQVARVLQEGGWEPSIFTPSGRPSMAKETLAKVDHPLASAMLECKHVTKMASAYLGNFLELCDGEYLHPKINPLGARTGRMSISEPSLQNLPRGDPLVRDAFIPSPGNSLLLCDYDQVEMRLMTHFARSERLADAFKHGDIFTNMARDLFNDPTIDKGSTLRQLTKQCTYAKIYGAGAAKFAETAGLSFERGKAFVDAYDRGFPEVRQFQDAVTKVASERNRTDGIAWVQSPMGRKHVALHQEDLYKLVNYLVQGTAADLLKEKLVELDKAGLADMFVLPVHDELILDVPTEDVDEVSATLQAIMADDSYLVPLTAEAAVVHRWGDKYRMGS